MLYYEINRPFMDRTHGVIEPGIYCKDMYVTNKQLVPGMIIYMAERIWVEQDGTIEYIKNRFDIEKPVDLKEFSWIKLKARELK